jgi:hypothetical protein
VADSPNKRKRTPEELVQAIERMADDDEAERIAELGEKDLDREIREAGGDPEGIAARGQALVDRLVHGGAPMRMAAGMPPRQAFLAILAEAARDARKKAILDEDLGSKKLEELSDEELARLVARVRGG